MTDQELKYWDQMRDALDFLLKIDSLKESSPKIETMEAIALGRKANLEDIERYMNEFRDRVRSVCTYSDRYYHDGWIIKTD